MTTALQVANIGLKRILVQGQDAPLEADEYADFYIAMNNWMAAKEADGLRLGYTPVTDGADEVTVPAGAIMGIAANVAILVAADYGGTISQSLAAEAAQGLRTMERIGVNIGQTSEHPNLPFGSGNRDSVGGAEMFGEPVSMLMTMAGNTTATTFESSSQLKKVRGFWELIAYEGLRPDITGRVYFVRDAATRVNLKLTGKVKSTGSNNCVIGFDKNAEGTTFEVAVPAVSTTPTPFTVTGSVTMNPGEFLEVYIAHLGGADDMTLTEATWEIT